MITLAQLVAGVGLAGKRGHYKLFVNLFAQSGCAKNCGRTAHTLFALVPEHWLK